jgi:hypothetical protein
VIWKPTTTILAGGSSPVISVIGVNNPTYNDNAGVKLKGYLVKNRIIYEIKNLASITVPFIP